MMTDIFCDRCGLKISNTLYEVGKEKLCALCWLGKEEGSKPKYWVTDAYWTVESLDSWKNPPFDIQDPIEAAKWKWSKKDGWSLK